MDARLPFQPMARKNLFPLIVCLASILACGCRTNSSRANTKLTEPGLILFVTIDQLRPDIMEAVSPRFGPGGLRLLLEKGVVYSNAEFEHAITETGPGHATLFTGVNPSVHGIVSNAWYNRTIARQTYCVEDINSAGKSLGVSPHSLLAPTFGDDLIDVSGGQTRVISISGKDRAAILPGGQKGTAIWFSKSSGRFVSSSFYPSAGKLLPLGAEQDAQISRYLGTSWEPLQPAESYIYKRGVGCGEAQSAGFSHPYGSSAGPGFLSQLGTGPAVDELTVNMAEKVIKSQELGQHGTTDLLAVSLSALDYAGHFYSPTSPEYEDTLLRADRLVARLITAAKAELGSARLLVVLSADHGATDGPGFTQQSGHPAGWLHGQKEIRQAIDRAEMSRNGAPPIPVLIVEPYLYVGQGQWREKFLETLKGELQTVPGIAEAAIADPSAPGFGGQFSAELKANFNPARSGDLQLIPQAGWTFDIAGPKGKYFCASHGSPHPYDRHVPMIFYSTDLKHQVVERRVSPRSIAATIRALTGAKQPETAAPVLEEIDREMRPQAR